MSAYSFSIGLSLIPKINKSETPRSNFYLGALSFLRKQFAYLKK